MVKTGEGERSNGTVVKLYLAPTVDTEYRYRDTEFMLIKVH